MVKKLKNIMEVLKAFFPEINKELSIKEVSAKIKLSYQPTYTYLKELAEKDIFNHKRAGNVHLYSLNLKNPVVIKQIENIEFETKEKLVRNLDNKIQKILEELLTQIQEMPVLLCLLFGSTARKTRVKISDIDLFLVVSEAVYSEKIKRICNTFNMKYNVKLSPIVVSLKEFKGMLIERNDFTNNLLKEKIVLFGLEFYYRELIRSREVLK
ncbi:MAG: nucleotidyltransferase domain-containing protein [Nanoarchaeota archaeon]|nr:nucleotidyltransferase domain-containing protein [Nanoarchaeota archaeon]MBU4283913.1 nucleotidyltransferase domain-containing protein [Nanoarchaeota archaeon]MBU4493538.1 nucleotidyltransferase domain-containing protein [Nanoarchaeota archaeon]MCG2719764.1 nucleotidyltransferase domain-containing protein [Nanoarchaeota archaeon]